MTAFVALLALDARRIEEGRLDIAPCARVAALSASAAQPPVPENDGHFHSLSEYGLPAPDEVAGAGAAGTDGCGGRRLHRLGLTDALQWYMANVHAPLLSLPVVQVGSR